MYVAQQFAVEPELALRQAAERGVGDLVTHSARGLDATMLPFVWLPDPAGFGVLTTHMARVNLQWHDQGPAMMVVHGPDAYISPQIVPPAAGEQRVPTVPTWNYLAVHLFGQLVVHHDPDWKLASLRDLVDRHESQWRLEHAAPGGIEALLPAIVGIEFVIESVVGKAKLSQNRSSTDVRSMADELAAAGHSPATAELMRTLALPYIAQREERVARAREQARARTDDDSAAANRPR